MILRKIVDEIRSNVQSYISSDDSRIQDLMLEEKIHSARAAILGNYFMSQQTLGSENIQQIDLDFVEREVVDNTVQYDIPAAIDLGPDGDGITHVGCRKGNKKFMRINNDRGHIHRHSVLKNLAVVKWDYKVGPQGRGYITFYNNDRLESPIIRGVFADPTSVLGFRKDVDNYPASRKVIRDIVEMITIDLTKGSRIPTDRVSDGSDKPQQ